MMLKSTFAPNLSTVFPTITKLPKLSSLICSVLKQCPQAVRQNVPATFKTAAAAAALIPVPHHKLPPTSAYIHLPFCRKRCHYCDFPIIALGSSPSSSPLPLEDDPRILNYIQTLLREIKATPVSFSPHPTPLETVFFGGGTPSLVPPDLVHVLLECLRSRFGVVSDAEISIEMDPGTFDRVKLKKLMEIGVNRLSLGVQAFQDDLLKACGRAHGVKEVYEALEIFKSNEVGNWSLDLISSLPHQTLDMWEESLSLTIDAQPPHVSVYDLQVENDTKFGHLYTPGEFPLPTEDLSAEFYKTASRMLKEAGYEHYEISSYCKKGYECKHNYAYWKNIPFYGFGLGSASYLNGTRFSRPRKLKDYMKFVESLENGTITYSDGTSAAADEKDMAMDVVMLSLRTAKGLDMKSFGEVFGNDKAFSLCKAYEPYIESGHVIVSDEHNRNVTANELRLLLQHDEHKKREKQLGFLRLSDPDGFLLSNELISHAFSVLGS